MIHTSYHAQQWPGATPLPSCKQPKHNALATPFWNEFTPAQARHRIPTVLGAITVAPPLLDKIRSRDFRILWGPGLSHEVHDHRAGRHCLDLFHIQYQLPSRIFFCQPR